MFDIEKISKLAKLALFKQELEQLEKDMNSIVEFVQGITEFETGEYEPMLINKNLMRADKAEEFDGIDQVIQNFPEKEDRFMAIKKVINLDDETNN